MQLRDGIKLTICACLLIPCSFSGNNIGGEGASALAESLKQKTTLTDLNLEGMSELSEFMFAYNRQDQANILHIQGTELALKEHRLWLSL